MRLLPVALPVPLRKVFDYLAAPDGAVPAPGTRVRVHFGRRAHIGIVAGAAHAQAQPGLQYRPIDEVLDASPLLPESLLQLCRWAAEYYLHPPGEVLSTALPSLLRQRAAVRAAPGYIILTAAGAAARAQLPRRALRLQALLDALRDGPQRRADLPVDAATLARARAQGWIADRAADAADGSAMAGVPAPAPAPVAGGAIDAAAADIAQPALPALTAAQAAVLADCPAPGSGFAAVLLEGVTGSGKTELYLRLAAQALAQGLQVLVLAPEIGLTPQLAERFTQRFGARVACYHSALGEAERARTWLAARDGRIDLIVGTRSAVFVPLARPGLFIVDEEHDASYKQAESFRYHARDIAVKRAQLSGVPVLLGSATPALESLANTAAGRYRHLQLPARVSGEAPPRIGVLDLRAQPLDAGLSTPLLAATARHLEAGGQVLLFQNRRGYAPALLCHACGWAAHCPHCDARLVLYRRGGLRCQHCGHRCAAPQACPDCGAAALLALGQGTERIEDALRRHFPRYRVERFDSDRLARAGELPRLLADVRSGAVHILVGTQVLAKGHDFAGLSFAGIVDADQALYGTDFRALERMGQLLTQVAGRVGRAGQPGEVLLQTHQPQHPLLRLLLGSGYRAFAEAVLAERRGAGLPPYAHLALLRADSAAPGAALAFLEAVRALLPVHGEVDCFGPVPASMERRAGRYRAQLLLRARTRARLHAALRGHLDTLDALPTARGVHWSLDVDPVDLF